MYQKLIKGLRYGNGVKFFFHNNREMTVVLRDGEPPIGGMLNILIYLHSEFREIEPILITDFKNKKNNNNNKKKSLVK